MVAFTVKLPSVRQVPISQLTCNFFQVSLTNSLILVSCLGQNVAASAPRPPFYPLHKRSLQVAPTAASSCRSVHSNYKPGRKEGRENEGMDRATRRGGRRCRLERPLEPIANPEAERRYFGRLLFNGSPKMIATLGTWFLFKTYESQSYHTYIYQITCYLKRMRVPTLSELFMNPILYICL